MCIFYSAQPRSNKLNQCLVYSFLALASLFLCYLRCYVVACPRVNIASVAAVVNVANHLKLIGFDCLTRTLRLSFSLHIHLINPRQQTLSPVALCSLVRVKNRNQKVIVVWTLHTEHRHSVNQAHVTRSSTQTTTDSSLDMNKPQRNRQCHKIHFFSVNRVF